MSALPKGWIETSIADITAYVQRGKGPKYSEEPNEFPVINQKAIRWSGIQAEHLKYVKKDTWDSYTEERFIKAGDILWNSTGTGTIGRACLLDDKEVVKAKVVDSHVTILRANQAVEPRYLFSWIRSPKIQFDIESLSTGTTNQIELAKNKVLETKIPLAPLNEQIRIADKLDSILAKIDQAQARLEKIPTILKRFRQAILAAATSGELTREWRESKELTTEWEPVKLSTIISKIEAGKNIKCDERPPHDNEFGIIKISAVTWGVYNEEQSKTLKDKSLFIEDRRVKVGDFLISRANTLELLGMPVIVHKVTKNLMLSDKVLRLVMPTEDKAWLDIFLRSPSGRLEIQSRATGNQESMRNIGQKALCDIDVLLPTPLEKAEIVMLVGILISHAEIVEKQYYTMKNRLDKLTQSILAKAFRGELVEQDPNDEPARQLLERIKKQRLDSPKPAKKIRTTTKNVNSTGELEPTVAESDLSQSEILMLLQKSNSELTAQQLIDKLTEQTFEQIDSLFTELKRLLDMQAIAKVGTGESCTFKAIKK